MTPILPRVASCILTLLLVGCFPAVWEWEPDISSSLRYISEDFELPIECERDDPLELEIGYGENAFIPMPEGHTFKVYYGLQGGSHVYLGMRIKNPETTHPIQVVTLELLDDDRCAVARDSPGPGPEPAPGDAGVDGACMPYVVAQDRGTVDATKHLNARGEFEDAGILVQHSWNDYGGGSEDRARLTVRDQCGRSASVERRVTHR